ncbi:MAG: hypothetical protein E6R03_16405 [Hyphomicrobiaceae bacterium]|nr:MAG: hypothetical protein E6R03_16405 [Hyphomicrobiaceae bacterium]
MATTLGELLDASRLNVGVTPGTHQILVRLGKVEAILNPEEAVSFHRELTVLLRRLYGVSLVILDPPSRP